MIIYMEHRAWSGAVTIREVEVSDDYVPYVTITTPYEHARKEWELELINDCDMDTPTPIEDLEF